MASPKQPERQSADVTTTTCCIVGGGPAGMVLTYLLARQGISVTLLEAHTDFDREFRGDTVHPSTMDLMDELGLADRLLRLRHSRISSVTIPTANGSLTFAPFTRTKTRHPYITMMPQADFLTFLAQEARTFPNVDLRMGARVEELVTVNGTVCGVRYRSDRGWHEIRALLTIGTDGRFSRLRRLGSFSAVTTSPPMDVLWFRLPRATSDAEGAIAQAANGHMAIMLDRNDHWQVAYMIIKGSFQQIRAAGIEAMRESVASVLPQFADRVGALHDWKQISLLSVASDRLRRWYNPGLLLIGDAAHTMSPVGGVGINYAIQDAIVAANLLTEPLRAGRVEERDLRAVQRSREWPTRVIQALQSFAQKRVVSSVLNDRLPSQLPGFLPHLINLPIIRDIPGRLLSSGIWPVHARI